MNFKTIMEDLTENDTEKILYYFNQGFEIGKEEAIHCLVNKMSLSNISIEEISNITNLPLNEVSNFLK